MNKQIKVLKNRADAARLLYKKNMMTRAEAHAEILPYIIAFNEKSEIIAKKYNVRPGKLIFEKYIR